MTSYIVDFSKVKTMYELHQLLKDSFYFPDYYGMNMDAFWDCITWDIDIPATIYISGIDRLPKDLCSAKEKLKEILNRAVKWYEKMGMELNVVYDDYSIKLQMEQFQTAPCCLIAPAHTDSCFFIQYVIFYPQPRLQATSRCTAWKLCYFSQCASIYR